MLCCVVWCYVVMLFSCGCLEIFLSCGYLDLSSLLVLCCVRLSCVVLSCLVFMCVLSCFLFCLVSSCRQVVLSCGYLVLPCRLVVVLCCVGVGVVQNETFKKEKIRIWPMRRCFHWTQVKKSGCRRFYCAKNSTKMGLSFIQSMFYIRYNIHYLIDLWQYFQFFVCSFFLFLLIYDNMSPLLAKKIKFLDDRWSLFLFQFVQ